MLGYMPCMLSVEKKRTFHGTDKAVESWLTDEEMEELKEMGLG